MIQSEAPWIAGVAQTGGFPIGRRANSAATRQSTRERIHFVYKLHTGMYSNDGRAPYFDAPVDSARMQPIAGAPRRSQGPTEVT
jgi:hypothetical protein